MIKQAVSNEDMKKPCTRIKFMDLPVLTWFTYRGRLFQKLHMLNGSNCYKWEVGYGYIQPSEEVAPVEPPQITNNPKPKRRPHTIGILTSDMRLHINEQFTKQHA